MKLKPRPYALLKLGALLAGISFITLGFVTDSAEFMLLLSYTLGLLFIAYDLFEKRE